MSAQSAARAQPDANHLALVVAIEFPADRAEADGELNVYFERALAQPLANQLAFELAKHLPSLDGLGLVWMAACFDQAQILRPDLPVHSALAGLYLAGVRDGQAPQVMTLQALRGKPPVPALEVDTRLLGGPMLLLPFAIVGAPKLLAQARALLEEKLLDTGLTDARTALMLNQALGRNAEHARLMTLDDLAALCAVQLEHAGLSEVWRILELAIFTPGANASYTIGNTRLSWSGSALRADFLPWLPSERAIAEFANAALLSRQALAVLSAHGLQAVEACAASGTAEWSEHFWIDWAPNPPAALKIVDSVHLFEDRRMGVVLYALRAADASLLGCAYPRTATAHRALLARLADQSPRLVREAIAQ